MTLYRQILKQAWTIVWHNRFLWIFGFFAAILGTGGVFEALFKASERLSEKTPTISTVLSQIFQAENLKRYYETLKILFSKEEWIPFTISILITLGVLAVSLVFIWLAVISATSLINASQKIFQGEGTTFGDEFRASKKYLWPVLGLFVTAKIIILGLLLLISWPMIYPMESLLKIILIFIVFVGFITLSLIIYFITIYAAAYIILRGKRFCSALKESINLFLNNWLISLEMAVLLFLINLLFGLAFILSVIIVGMPILLLVLIFFLLKWSLGVSLILFLGVLILSLFLIILGSFFTAFQYSCWTLLFVRLTSGKGESKLIRLTKRLSQIFLAKG